ncbi:MAG: iron ABC transporter permease [Flavobacteriaceae bacterium]|nr:iron ABC transporter permease [Flavobacteriaceae bacterium]
MFAEKTYVRTFLILSSGLVLVFMVNLMLGSVHIPFSQVVKSLTGTEIENQSWQYIVKNYRLPKAITAVIVGSGLGLSGLLMQTLFRNPLAGPFVLGISSGASLGVAFLIMGAGLIGGLASDVLTSNWSLVIASSLGSFLVLLAVMVVSVRVRDTMAILIIGLMFASLTAAVVSVLSYFATAEELQQFIFWGFGSLGNLAWKEISVLLIFYILGCILCLVSIKALNSFLLGENYSRSMGLNLKKSRIIIILATSILAGSITAFAGPIAFIGLAIPHLARQLFNTSAHAILFPAILLIGAIIMLICDSIAQLPFTDYSLPINAITSIFGAPLVIWLLVRKRKMIF